jgi:hypothetical protein
MLAASFRVVTAHLVPRPRRCKQALLVATVILAGCGGSGAPQAQTQTLKGPGYSFRAPAGWTRERTGRELSARRDSQLVQVASFPLVRPYTSALFGRVAGELALRMKSVAAQSGGTIAGTRTVTVSGIRSHAYEVKVADHVDEYTFVLDGMHEYQLLCRRRSSDRGAFCDSLLTSFALA